MHTPAHSHFVAICGINGKRKGCFGRKCMCLCMCSIAYIVEVYYAYAYACLNVFSALYLLTTRTPDPNEWVSQVQKKLFGVYMYITHIYRQTECVRVRFGVTAARHCNLHTYIRTVGTHMHMYTRTEKNIVHLNFQLRTTIFYS